MQEDQKSKKFSNGQDVHLLLGQKLVNESAAEASCQIDAAADRKWFNHNPKAKRRERPASIRELKAFGMPPGTLAVIFRGPNGTQFRILIDAAEQN